MRPPMPRCRRCFFRTVWLSSGVVSPARSRVPCYRNCLLRTVWPFSDAVPEASGIMLDFTSALYLGFRHPSASALPWKALTLGRPGSLQEPPGSIAVASELAALQGCEAATMLPSTLHLFWDLFSTFRRRDAVIYIEATTYAIARWGVQRASLGAPVYTFAPDGVAELEHL